jgi:hypothetical protein
MKDAHAAEYAHIRAWGRLLGSHGAYVDYQVRLARDEHAPPTAIYRDLPRSETQPARWVTLEEVEDPAAAARVLAILADMGGAPGHTPAPAPA